MTIFWSLLPYIEHGNHQRYLVEHRSIPIVRLYLSPSDPSIDPKTDTTVSSYAANAQLFHGAPKLPGVVPDGTSNTIAFAEHYARCNTFHYEWTTTAPVGQTVLVRRATFADGGTLFGNQNFADVYPVRAKGGGTTGSDPTRTFQVAPSPKDCRDDVAQGPHRNGMLAGMLDGSVRTLSVGMSPPTFWASVTPNGGEVLGSDW